MNRTANPNLGFLLGLAGVLCFAFSLPLTRIAVLEIDAIDVTILRILIAGLGAAALLQVNAASVPDMNTLLLVVVVSLGVVLGFPLFTALAMKSGAAGRGGVVLGIMPLLTAAIGNMVMREKSPLTFWLFAIAGSALVVVFSWSGGAGSLSVGDIYLFMAAISASAGYAIGVLVGKRMPVWQVICWALVVSLPFSLTSVFTVDFNEVFAAPLGVKTAILYLGLVSQLGGFFLWYRGLAMGGVALVSQAQLLQPFFTLVIAWMLVGETITLQVIAFAFLIVLTIAGGRMALGLSAKRRKPG